MNKQDIKELIQLMKEENMKVISIETGDLEIYLEAFADEPGTEKKKVRSSYSEGEKSSPSLLNEGGELVDIKADQIGTFYTQPEEDSDETFVKLGDKVVAGDQVGLIETMKIFNEFKVAQSGTIEEILVKNGESVEFGQVVMRLRSEEA